MAFEWDEQKATENLAKHGIPFEYASRVFHDRYHIEEAEDPGFYDEDRSYAIGMVENILLFVAFTYRRDTIRIISARKATSRERRHYHEIYP